MDTAARKNVRELALTMEATYRGEPDGLRAAQDHARHVITVLRDLFPGESDDTLCCVCRAVSSTVARLAQIPVQHAGVAMEGMIAAYPLAAGALAGVYLLPEADEGPALAGLSGDRNPMTGQYL